MRVGVWLGCFVAVGGKVLAGGVKESVGGSGEGEAEVTAPNPSGSIKQKNSTRIPANTNISNAGRTFLKRMG
jgi:hypothetical protein